MGWLENDYLKKSVVIIVWGTKVKIDGGPKTAKEVTRKTIGTSWPFSEKNPWIPDYYVIYILCYC